MEKRKLMLRLEDLDIASFEISESEAGQGTVRGNQSNWRTCYSECWSMCLADSDCCSEWPGECTANC
jgi:hypothetical protein